MFDISIPIFANPAEIEKLPSSSKNPSLILFLKFINPSYTSLITSFTPSRPLKLPASSQKVSYMASTTSRIIAKPPAKIFKTFNTFEKFSLNSSDNT